MEGVKDIYRWGKGWNMTRKLDTLSSLYHSGNDERLSRERDADRWQNVQAFSSRILDILERNDPDNEDSYWWEKCDWKLILYSPGKKISFLKNCLDSWNSWLRYIPIYLYYYVQVKANNFLGYELNFTFISNDRNKIAFNWINKYTYCERQTILLFSYIWTYNNYSSNVFHCEYIVQNDASN